MIAVAPNLSSITHRKAHPRATPTDRALRWAVHTALMSAGPRR
jgi:hypothetical protein